MGAIVIIKQEIYFGKRTLQTTHYFPEEYNETELSQIWGAIFLLHV